MPSDLSKIPAGRCHTEAKSGRTLGCTTWCTLNRPFAMDPVSCQRRPTLDGNKKSTERTLIEDADVNGYLRPFGPDEFEAVEETVTLPKGTTCKELSDCWEVVNGEYDGIRFFKWQE